MLKAQKTLLTHLERMARELEWWKRETADETDEVGENGEDGTGDGDEAGGDPGADAVEQNDDDDSDEDAVAHRWEQEARLLRGMEQAEDAEHNAAGEDVDVMQWLKSDGSDGDADDEARGRERGDDTGEDEHAGGEPGADGLTGYHAEWAAELEAEIMAGYPGERLADGERSSGDDGADDEFQYDSPEIAALLDCSGAGAGSLEAFMPPW